MVVRYQTGPQLGLPLHEPLNLRNFSMPTMLGMGPTAGPAAAAQGSGPGLVGAMLQQPSGSLASFTGALPEMRHSSLPALTLPSSMPPPSGVALGGMSSDVPSGMPDGIPGLDQSDLGAHSCF